MKKILLIAVAQLVAIISIGQQIPNSDFELWENVASNQEPVNWNSFLSASGGLATFAANQIESSADVRPGSTGTRSCRINARSVLGIVANGNVTLGRINMGSSTPTNSANYNISLTSNTGFSEAFTGTPDSIIFWVKHSSGVSTDSARMKAVIHDAYDFRDPEDAASLTHRRAVAVKNFRTGGSWVRMSVPFVSVNSSIASNYILITFTTNKTPGGGLATDVLLIDDITLQYNTALSVNDDSYSSISQETPQFKFVGDNILFTSKGELNGTYQVVDLVGKTIQKGKINPSVAFDQKAGVYLIFIDTDAGRVTKRMYKN